MSTESTLQKRRVLLIDDDPALRMTLADSLELLGDYDVVQAHDGVSGLQSYFTAQPDCVVVDVRMPGLNGYQFVRAMRGDVATAQTPIIVLSALVQDYEQLAGLLSGADAYLTKPVRIVDLVRVIDEAVNLSASERQSRQHDLSQHES